MSRFMIWHSLDAKSSTYVPVGVTTPPEGTPACDVSVKALSNVARHLASAAVSFFTLSFVDTARVSAVVSHGMPAASSGMRLAAKIVHIDDEPSSTNDLNPAFDRFSSWK